MKICNRSPFNVLWNDMTFNISIFIYGVLFAEIKQYIYFALKISRRKTAYKIDSDKIELTVFKIENLHQVSEIVKRD